MKKHNVYRIGFIGKDGNTYLLSGVDKETNTVLLKILETGEYKEISLDAWYIYERKNLLKRFCV